MIMIMVAVAVIMAAVVAVVVVIIIIIIMIMMIMMMGRHGVEGRDELNLFNKTKCYLISFGFKSSRLIRNIRLISGWRRKRTVPIDGVFDTPQGTVSTNLNFGKL